MLSLSRRTPAAVLFPAPAGQPFMRKMIKNLMKMETINIAKGRLPEKKIRKKVWSFAKPRGGESPRVIKKPNLKFANAFFFSEHAESF